LTDIYCELPDVDNLKKQAYNLLEEYNNTYPSSKMNLVLFLNAISHIIRIVRIVTTPFGHALLVGVGGSGRKSLATLSTYIAGMEVIQIDAKIWQEEL
jgi:dynein heavy chain